MGKTELSAEQKAVVNHRGGALLVSAAAGSGKTTVLINRLLSKICDENDPCNVDDFLIITFTNAAASELRTKIAKEISSRLVNDSSNRHLRNQLTRIYLAKISTVHSFCTDVLKNYAYLTDFPADFRVGEEADCKALQRKAAEKTLDMVYSGRLQSAQIDRLLGMLGYSRNDNGLLDMIEELYKQLSCHADSEKWLEDWRHEFNAPESSDVFQTVWGKFLLARAKSVICSQLENMKLARDVVLATESLQNYAETFEGNTELLAAMAACNTAEELRAYAGASFGKLNGIKNCETPELKERVAKVRDHCKEIVPKYIELISCDGQQSLSEIREAGDALEGLLQLIKEFTKQYRALKRQRRILDYSDLEQETIRLLTDRATGAPTATARELSEKYREIMVDEYQDTNGVQEVIFRAISKNETNLFMVGDVKQAIYRFRLADPSIFLQKYETYQQTDDPHCMAPRKLLLSKNYRSDPQIIDAANHVFRTVMSKQVGGLEYGAEEELQAGVAPMVCDSPAVELHCLDTKVPKGTSAPVKEEAEAAFVAGQIAELLQGEHYITVKEETRRICPGDIAILMRSPAGDQSYFIKALAERGINSVCHRSENLLESTEVCSLLAILRIIQNPHQDIPLLTALTSPVFAFSADDLAQIRAADQDSDFYDALVHFSAENRKCAEFLQIYSFLRQKRRLPLPDFLDLICRKLSFFPVFGAMRDGAIRCARLNRLLEISGTYAGTDIADLGNFLRYIDVLNEQGVSLSLDETKSSDSVQIMTVHTSKGLEFPVVFLCGLSKPFNFSDNKQVICSDTQLFLGCNYVDNGRMVQYPTLAKRAIQEKNTMDTKSEELRILYVAMTRAQCRLIMTYCSNFMSTTVERIARQAAYPASVSACESARCNGDWILYAAAVRPEAGEIFQGCEPAELTDAPWKIQYHLVADESTDFAKTGTFSNMADDPLDDSCVKLHYPHIAAVQIPAKLTATQLKGRDLDAESAEHARMTVRNNRANIQPRQFEPGGHALTAAEQGTALHQFLQYCRYEECTTVEGIRGEIDRMAEACFLTQQQLQAIDSEKVLRFFRSDLGNVVLQAKELHREFKFSILANASDYFEDAGDEQVMLQGVVDCFMIDENGITILDYKTDDVAAGREMARAESYRAQLETYAKALRRVFDKPIARKVIYFFSTGTACEL